MRPLGFIGIHRQHGEDIPFSIEAASGGVAQRRRTLAGCGKIREHRRLRNADGQKNRLEEAQRKDLSVHWR